MPSAAVLLADGFEEIEAITVIDVLRRAEVKVTTLALADRQVQGAHAIAVQADALLADAGGTTFDLVVLPGGMPGSATLRDDPAVQALVTDQHAAGRKVAAVCAAPIALASAGLLEGRQATSFPSFADQLPGARYSEERVCVDGPITTSRGAGTAMEFALELVAQLVDRETADELAEAMLVARPTAAG